MTAPIEPFRVEVPETVLEDLRVRLANTRWPDQLPDVGSLQTGQVLKIPARAETSIEESAFVVELAYKTQRHALGSLGRRPLALPRIDIEVVLRIQRLAEPADPQVVLNALPLESPPVGDETLQRSGPTLETTYGDDLDDVEHAIEVSYEGFYELDDGTLADGSILDQHFSAMGGWISATLVRLGDLPMSYLPPLEKD